MTICYFKAIWYFRGSWYIFVVIRHKGIFPLWYVVPRKILRSNFWARGA
jgi:hypothetical protein